MIQQNNSTKSRYHELKTNPDPFGAILTKEKAAEFRKNDRDFKVGDTLILREYNPFTAYTGRYLLRKVTHIQIGYGIPDGFVMMSIRALTSIEEAIHAAGIQEHACHCNTTISSGGSS